MARANSVHRCAKESNAVMQRFKLCLTSDRGFVCSARLDEHTGDKGKAGRPVARPRLCTKQGVFEVKADVKDAILLEDNTMTLRVPAIQHNSGSDPVQITLIFRNIRQIKSYCKVHTSSSQ